MALNFTGRLPPPEEPVQGPGRAPVTVLACFGAAALLAGLVVAVALRQHKLDAPAPLPALVGVDAAVSPPARTPSKPTPAPSATAAAEPAWIMHKAAAPQPASPTPTAAAPQTQDPAVGKARMLAALRQVPHGAITLSVEDDPQAQALGRKLAGLFREAGWTVDEVSVFGAGPPRRGVAVAFGGAPADEAVREAFDAVGFQFSPPPASGIVQTPEIFVGVPYAAKGKP
jgi:hypothetical protein